jgi:hypothetical protein
MPSRLPVHNLDPAGSPDGYVPVISSGKFVLGSPSVDTTAEAERIRDVIGAALVAGTGMTVTVNDAGDTITLASVAGYTDEQVRDVIGAALVAGTGITVTVNDAADTITIAATGGYTDENARDAIGAALVAGTNVGIVVNDGADTITISATTDPEVVRDTIGTALVAGANVRITVNDAGDTITVSALCPLTTQIGGVPDFVWDADNKLVMTEAP